MVVQPCIRAVVGIILLLAAETSLIGDESTSVDKAQQQDPDTVAWAKPLAQDYVVVHQVRELADPNQWVCVGSPDLLRLPSGRLIASMELWLQTPNDGREGGIDYPNHCKIKASDDGGKTWQQISTNSVTWGSLFLVDDQLYMIGNNPRTRTIIIVRSPDMGRSWSEEVTLFDDAHYSGGATTVLIKSGFVYRAFEDNDRRSASFVVAGDLSMDLLDPSSWRMSPKVEPPRQTPAFSREAATDLVGRDSHGNWFLEGNVVDIRGQMSVLLRTRIDRQQTANVTSLCELEDDGRQMRYRFVQYYPMPGGQNKFKLLFDPVTQMYWTCTTMPPDSYQDPVLLKQRGIKSGPGNMRRILMLNYSLDCLNWFQAGCVAMSKNPLEAFNYTSQVIDGDDLLVLSRSSVGGELPYNNHDTNFITLHRIKGFRSLAIDLRQDFDYRTSREAVE